MLQDSQISISILNWCLKADQLWRVFAIEVWVKQVFPVWVTQPFKSWVQSIHKRNADWEIYFCSSHFFLHGLKWGRLPYHQGINARLLCHQFNWGEVCLNPLTFPIACNGILPPLTCGGAEASLGVKAFSWAWLTPTSGPTPCRPQHWGLC